MLENKYIKLRAVEMSDLDLLYEWENNTELWQVSNTLTPFSKYLLKKYIENTNLEIYQTKELKLMIDVKISENQYKTVGMLDIFDFDAFHKRAGIGIMINKNEQNKNYATEVLKIINNYCFSHLKLHQLYCNIAEDNEISLKLFQNAGFKISGKKMDWLATKNGYKTIYFLQYIPKLSEL